MPASARSASFDNADDLGNLVVLGAWDEQEFLANHQEEVLVLQVVVPSVPAHFPAAAVPGGEPEPDAGG